MKRERLATVHLDNELIEALADKVNLFDFYVLKDEILSILSRLPGAVRRILTLRFLEGLTYEEIAVVEGVSEGAVRTRLSRARKEFAKIYESTKS